MKKNRILAAGTCAAIFALAACNSEPEVVTVNNFDPMEEALKNAPPVEAPPMMQASRTYRCRDNSLVFVDFYTNNTAQIRLSRDGSPTVLTAEGGNPPYTAPGYSVSANAEEISLTAPGKGTLSCHI